MVPHISDEVGKSENQILNPLIPPSFHPYGQDLTRENFECFNNSMEPEVKIDPLIPMNDIDMHNSNLESDLIESIVSSRDTFHPPWSTFHGPMCLVSLDRFVPPTSSSNILYSQFVGPHADQVQIGHITQVEEQKGEYIFDISSPFQIPLCQDVFPSLMDNLKSSDLSNQ